MAATRRPDPEFDPPPSLLLRSGTSFDPDEHQRLVVNPFLGVLGLIGLIRLVQGLANSPLPGLAPLIIVPILVLPYLVQYHCLDCGRTGAYPRHRLHVCPEVASRSRGNHYRSRFPLPKTRTQMAIWFWILVAAGLLLAVIAASGPLV